MGEGAVESDRDAMSGDGVEDDRQDDVGPTESPAPGKGHSEQNSKQGYGNENPDGDPVAEGIQTDVVVRSNLRLGDSFVLTVLQDDAPVATLDASSTCASFCSFGPKRL